MARQCWPGATGSFACGRCDLKISSLPGRSPALLGQTQLAQPEVILPAVVARMRSVADAALRDHLLAALVALLPDEEMIRMVDRLLEEDEWLLELPFQQRILAEGRRQGETEVLLRQLRSRFGALPEDVTARLNTADAETLLRWSERILSASTLDAVFAE